MTTSVRELDGSTTELELFPDLCTARCDPRAPRPCGCGVCLTSVPVGTGRISILDDDGRGVCAQTCWSPIPGGAPTCLGGQACDRFARACTAPCTVDDACLLVPTPFETAAFARLPDDEPLPISCGLLTSECSRVHPSPDALDGFLGDACKTDFDCQPGHLCYRSSAGGPGTCARFSDCEGRGCGTDICIGLDPAVWVCARP
jgi:hypothetical protein